MLKGSSRKTDLFCLEWDRWKVPNLAAGLTLKAEPFLTNAPIISSHVLRSMLLCLNCSKTCPA